MASRLPSASAAQQYRTSSRPDAPRQSRFHARRFSCDCGPTRSTVRRIPSEQDQDVKGIVVGILLMSFARSSSSKVIFVLNDIREARSGIRFLIQLATFAIFIHDRVHLGMNSQRMLNAGGVREPLTFAICKCIVRFEIEKPVRLNSQNSLAPRNSHWIATQDIPVAEIAFGDATKA